MGSSAVTCSNWTIKISGSNIVCMKYQALVLAFALLLPFAASADEMEMKTQSKSGAPGTAAGLPADNAGKLPPSAKGPNPADQALRAKIRAKAPFWIEDSAHSATIRLGKDGTFSSEGMGGGSIAGNWKALNGELHLQWADGGEKYSYPVSGKGKELLIRGQAVKNNRYHLN